MKVSEIELSKLNVDDRVISVIGTLGRIESISNTKMYDSYSETFDYLIVYLWDNGKRSWVPHCESNCLEYVENLD